MILIAGGSGRLGGEVVRLLTARGLAVRVLTRDPARARNLEGSGVQVVRGDVREPDSLPAAMQGAGTVISAIHGFVGPDGVTPRSVDYEGNRNLIAAARAAGVERFILISMHGAAPDHPMELLRMKYRAEEELKASGPAWTIIRPTVSMETWAQAVGEPLLRSGKTRVFGRGVNPINFVAWSDVARFVELAVADRAMRGMAVDVGGPENLTMNEFVATFQRATGTDGAVSHVPLPIMRLMAVLMRPVNAALARQIEAGVLMDTRDMTLDASPTARRFPSIPQTTVAEMVRRVYAAAA